jgi:chromosome segregation ATPase
MLTCKQQLMAAAIAGAFVFAGSALALTKAEIKAEDDQIAAQYKSAKAQCDSLKANAKDICVAEAKGANKVAKAEFALRQKDTPKARYTVRVAQAEAEYDVAKEKCDDLAGNPKDVCLKDAKAALTTAKANAKADIEVGDAKRNASEDIGAARKEAKEEKRDANYAAAKERCDKYAGDAKDSCIAKAKTKFGVK